MEYYINMENKTTTMKNKTYKIQFFGGPMKIWNTLQTTTTLEEAKAFKKAQQEMCDYMVDFRIVEEVA